MSAFAGGLLETRARWRGLWPAAAVLLAAAAGALVSYASEQPQLVKAGLLSVGVAALLLLAVRLPVSVLPLAVVVGLLGLGNLELSRIVGVPVLGGQEKWVLLILAGVAVLGAALDASASRRPAWPAVLLLGGLFLTVCIGSLFYAAIGSWPGPPSFTRSCRWWRWLRASYGYGACVRPAPLWLASPPWVRYRLPWGYGSS